MADKGLVQVMVSSEIRDLWKEHAESHGVPLSHVIQNYMNHLVLGQADVFPPVRREELFDLWVKRHGGSHEDTRAA